MKNLLASSEKSVDCLPFQKIQKFIAIAKF
jgi:hypothetical protein